MTLSVNAKRRPKDPKAQSQLGAPYLLIFRHSSTKLDKVQRPPKVARPGAICYYALELGCLMIIRASDQEVNLTVLDPGEDEIRVLLHAQAI